jgi:hypothetical protein
MFTLDDTFSKLKLKQNIMDYKFLDTKQHAFHIIETELNGIKYAILPHYYGKIEYEDGQIVYYESEFGVRKITQEYKDGEILDLLTSDSEVMKMFSKPENYKNLLNTLSSEDCVNVMINFMYYVEEMKEGTIEDLINNIKSELEYKITGINFKK